MVPDNGNTLLVEPDQSHWREMLRNRGLRVTAPRLAVLTAVTETPHGDAEALASAARARLGALSTQAVYDNLHALVEIGLIRRIELAGQPSRYEARVGDNHHHLVCRCCGRTEDVDCAVGEAPCLEPTQSHGFSIEEAEVTYWGVCEPCQLSGGEEVL